MLHSPPSLAALVQDALALAESGQFEAAAAVLSEHDRHVRAFGTQVDATSMPAWQKLLQAQLHGIQQLAAARDAAATELFALTQARRAASAYGQVP